MCIKLGTEHYAANREYAVGYAISVLRTAKDWQDGQHALADHPTIGPWLRCAHHECGEMAEVQAILRDAERRIGGELPY